MSFPKLAVLIKRTFLILGIVVGVLLVLILIPSNNCIVEGTPIDTPSGSRKIEDLREGDPVWTRAPSGELQFGRVVAVYSSWSMAQRIIVLEDERILSATAQHPVATEAGWKPVGQLEASDSVWSRDGWTKVASATNTSSLVRVFDLEVEPNSNFLANGVLVHNKGPRYPHEASAISALRNIVISQITYSDEAGEGSYAPDLQVLSTEGLIDSVLGSGTKDGYTYRMTVAGDGSAFGVAATPLSKDKNFPRNFYVDETGVIRYTLENRPAWFKDLPLGQ